MSTAARRSRRPPRRVLVHSGTTDLRNAGDAAMLQVGVARLARLWPEADIGVLTSDAHALRRLCPRVRAVSADAFREWTADRYLFGPLERRLPRAARVPLSSLERSLRRRWPAGATRLAAAGWRLGGHDPAPLIASLAETAGSDLIFVCGQGTLADAAAARARGLLGLIETAHTLGVPAVMVGQGLGPIEEPALRARAAHALQSVDFIALREGRRAAVLLAALGFDAARTLVTGDEAVELAHAARQPSCGTGIGVNVRIADNAGTDASVLAALRPALAALARRRTAPFVPLPISNHPRGTKDPAAIRELLRGIGDGGDGGEALRTPADVIGQAARCRVVVTGAYHAAVFALSQGIPTVCIGRSRYVLDKMDGLRDLFGDGCRVVALGGSEAAEAVGREADTLWDAAARLRPELLLAAANQMARACAAYERIARMFVPGADGATVTPAAALEVS